MFIHEPSDKHVPIYTLVLWDNPAMAGRAVELCNSIEHRAKDIKFHLSEADANDILRGGGVEPIDPKARDADLLLVAFEEMARSLPSEISRWFSNWAAKRRCDYGALAELDAPALLSRSEIHQLASQPDVRWPQPEACESGFRRFLQQTAERARVDFICGALEADLEEATRNFRYLPAQRSPFSHAHPE